MKVQGVPKKCNYFNLFLFAHILYKKLKTQDTFSQIGWILFESQTNFL